MKKGWLFGCGIAGIVGVAVCAGVSFLVWGVLALTQPVVDASDEFLRLLGQEKFAEAYAATANGYRAQQDEQSFTAAAKQLGLTKFSSASWSQREIRNQLGKTEGSVTSKDGSVTPVRINHVSEDGKWKVVGVNYGGVDLVTIKVQ